MGENFLLTVYPNTPNEEISARYLRQKDQPGFDLKNLSWKISEPDGSYSCERSQHQIRDDN